MGPAHNHDVDMSPVRAGAEDAEPLLALREAAAAWLGSRGIRQWAPGGVSVEQVRLQVGAGEWYVARAAGSVVAGLRLLWSDETFWGLRPADAVYVHGLVVGRAHAGIGLGRALLTWAAAQGQEAGRGWLRLDCMEDNHALRGYYERLGFSAVGRHDSEDAGHPVVLLQKPVAAVTSDPFLSG